MVEWPVLQMVCNGKVTQIVQPLSFPNGLIRGFQFNQLFSVYLHQRLNFSKPIIFIQILSNVLVFFFEITADDLCGVTPCLNGATCLQDGTNRTCVCVDRYEGDSCQIGWLHPGWKKKSVIWEKIRRGQIFRIPSQIWCICYFITQTQSPVILYHAKTVLHVLEIRRQGNTLVNVCCLSTGRIVKLVRINSFLIWVTKIKNIIS